MTVVCSIINANYIVKYLIYEVVSILKFCTFRVIVSHCSS